MRSEVCVSRFSTVIPSNLWIAQRASQDCRGTWVLAGTTLLPASRTNPDPSACPHRARAARDGARDDTELGVGSQPGPLLSNSEVRRLKSESEVRVRRFEVRRLTPEVRRPLYPPCFRSVSTCLAISFSVSKTPGPWKATASIMGSFLRRSCFDSASTGRTLGRSRLLSCKT
jgi:hypothetical protein